MAFQVSKTLEKGLGFGRGSVEGVYNQYYNPTCNDCDTWPELKICDGGIARNKINYVSREIRNRFLKKGYCGSEGYYDPDYPYKRHYDPNPYFSETAPTYLFKGVKNSLQEYLPKKVYIPYKKETQDKKMEINEFENSMLIFILLFLFVFTLKFCF